MKRSLFRLSAIFVLCILWSSAGLALTCSDVLPGARSGSHVPKGPGVARGYDLPYSNACYMVWPSPATGWSYANEASRKKCQGLKNAEVLLFEPDGGSNHSLCVFRIVAAGGNGDEEPDPANSDHNERRSSLSPYLISRINACVESSWALADLFKNDKCGTNFSICDVRLDFSRAICGEINEKVSWESEYLAYKKSRLARAAPSPPIPTSPVNFKKPWWVLKVCNYANDGTLSVAISIKRPTEHTIAGWTNVEPGECENAEVENFGDWPWAEFYIHGFTENWQWPSRKAADQIFCVKMKKFARVISPNYTCASDEEDRGFSREVINKGDDIKTVRQINYK